MGGDKDLAINTSISKIDPTEFDVTITALLIGIGAEKYVNIFRKHNIGQTTLTELSDEDLCKLGVDDAEIRKKLITEVKNLPIYEELLLNIPREHINLNPIEIADVLEESSQHLYRIYLSILANTLALKKTPKLYDSLLFRDKYASDVALVTLNEITNILNSMDIALHTKMKMLTNDSSNKKSKKIIVGTVGSAVIAVLAVLFVKSLKQLK